MNTLGDFPIQASKAIKTSSFSTPRPIVAERSALGTPNLEVWGSILGVVTLFTFAPYLFIAVSFMSCEKIVFSPHNRENRMSYVERMSCSAPEL